MQTFALRGRPEPFDTEITRELLPARNLAEMRCHQPGGGGDQDQTLGGKNAHEKGSRQSAAVAEVNTRPWHRSERTSAALGGRENWKAEVTSAAVR